MSAMANGCRAGSSAANQCIGLRRTHGMDDRFEIAAGGGVGEDDRGRACARSSDPSASSTSVPNRFTTAASPAVSGRNRVARQRVGVDGGNAKLLRTVRGRGSCRSRSRPSDAIRLALSSTTGWPARAVAARKRVRHQHRDRQRTDAARNRRQRAGNLPDVRMHVADEDAPFRPEHLRAADGLQGNSDCGDGGVGHASSSRRR